MSPALTRRHILRGAAGAGAAGLLLGGTAVSYAATTSSRPRVAIIGGGSGGVAATYFLAGDCDVTVFEERSKIGGHCDSREIDYHGTPITVDIGAQFFHPDTHPIYTTLLEELGLYNPDHPEAGSTLQAPGSVCVFSRGGGWPRFSSTKPYLTPIPAIDFAIYSQHARQVILDNSSWEIRVDDWIAGLPVTPGFKDDVLFPWISALIGTTHANAARSSIRSILQTFALAFPANLLSGASTYNSKIGFEGNLHRMLDRSPTAQVLLNSPVLGVSHDGALWTVRTAAGDQGPFDAVVMNAPPHTSKSLLRGSPWAADIVAALGGYEYFDARIVIHTDPVYVHPSRSLWTVYNGEVAGVECEGSVWEGGILPKTAAGATVDVFKSWAQRRAANPAQVLAERRFQHPLITPGVIRATRTVNAAQGRNGLYFCGQHTTGFDLQEATVYSAMKVADALAPGSATLASLRDRLALRGRTGISYDL